jgi:hypothetical protein
MKKGGLMEKKRGVKTKTFYFIIFFICFLVVGSNCFGKIYHIDPISGSSKNDGSAFSPLKCWFDLPTMNQGDDVFFRCDSAYYPPKSLKVYWEGTADNTVEIGSYFLEGGIVKYGVKNKRPLISGSNHKVPENSCFGTRNTWGGLIQVDSKDYVQIKNLHLYQSGFRGISFSGNLNNKTNSAFFLIKNVKVEESYGPGILIEKNAYNYGLIEECEVTKSAYSWKTGCESDWSVALVVFGSPFSHTVIRNNYVHENYGEGIGSCKVGCNSQEENSGFVTIENNVVWANRRVDIYVDRSEHNIIKGNVLAGNQDSAYSSITTDQRSWHQFGIWLNVENRGDCPNSTNNNFVYDNYVAGHYAGIGLASSYDSGTMENNYFFNNTSIANRYNYFIGGLENYNTRNLVFKNNVSYCPDNTVCKDVNRDQEWVSRKIIADYNGWEKQPLFWKGTNDQETDDLWNRTDGWQSLQSIPKKTEFLPVSGNVCIGKGVPLDYIEIPSYSLFNQVKKDISKVLSWNIGAGFNFDQISDKNDIIPAPILQIK